MNADARKIISDVVAGLVKGTSFRKLFSLLESGADLANHVNYGLELIAKKSNADELRADYRGLIRVSLLRGRADVSDDHWLKAVSLEFKGDKFEVVPFKAKPAGSKGGKKAAPKVDGISEEAVKAKIEEAVKARKAEITAAQKSAVDTAKAKTSEEAKRRQTAEKEAGKIAAELEKANTKIAELQAALDTKSRQLRVATRALKALKAGEDLLNAIEAA